MADTYVGYYFKLNPKLHWDEILLAQLQNLSFESFEITKDGINAYVKKDLHTDDFLKDIPLIHSNQLEIEYHIETIKPVNWNAKWESEFKPIHIGSDCVIRGDFHQKFDKKLELIINPKMSFGTGHHQTTHLMMEFVLETSFEDMTVLDMGCGTGILAIAASKKGAERVEAIDNDLWCVENAQENSALNKCQNISVTLGSELKKDHAFYDFIFANINHNVLVDQMQSYAKALKTKGTLFLSGFYRDDIAALEKKCKENGLTVIEQRQKDAWCAMRCIN